MESKYSHDDKFIPCGASKCTTCMNMKIQQIDTDLSLPLPTSTVPYDMDVPTNEVVQVVADVNAQWDLDTDLELMVSLFKNNVYDEHVIPSVAQFFLMVRKHSLQNSTHPMVMKAIKHYANWVTHMPQETKVALLEKVFEMNGDE